MASNLVRLCEADVPGAKFVHDSVEGHTNTQLRRWLKCRGLTTAGNRPALIKRCQTAVDANVSIDPKVDGGSWQQIKNNSRTTQSQTRSLPILPVTGWKKFPSISLPKHFNSGHVYHYLIESVTSVTVSSVQNVDGQGDSDSDEATSDIHTSKPLTKGRNLFRSGHVKDLQDHDSSDFYFIKSKVQASYTADTHYSTTVTLSKHSGVVKEGTCSCVASGLGRCCHVAALLLALEDYIEQFGHELRTCTQKACEWNKGRKSQKNPSAVFGAAYPSMKKQQNRPRKSGDFVITSDPRPTSLRTNDISAQDRNSFLINLKTIQDGECGWTNLLDMEYEDFSLEEYGEEVLRSQCQQFHENLFQQCQEHDKPFCVDRTENQATDETWHSFRWCRITASNCKLVACVKSGHDSLLKSLLWSPGFSTAALRYGIGHECDAFGQFSSNNPKLDVRKTGLWINPKYPMLGCSPDGIVSDNESVGLLEIKCPYILRDLDPNSCKEELTPKQLSNFCCTFSADGNLILKKNHAYYYQVQMQMALCEKSYCFFVVWSPKGMSVQRISFDEVLWKYTCPKLVKFHEEFLVPEFFLKRVPLGLPALRLVKL